MPLVHAYADGTRYLNQVIKVREATPDEMPVAWRIMLAAFEEYRGALEPPSGALTESLDEFKASAARGGAALAFISGEAVGSARYEFMPDHVYCSRISVVPSHRGLGLAGAILDYVDQRALECRYAEVRLSTREVMESNQRLYLRHGYEVVAREQHPKGEGIVLVLSKMVS